jgi:outer membrane protein OmpU
MRTHRSLAPQLAQDRDARSLRATPCIAAIALATLAFPLTGNASQVAIYGIYDLGLTRISNANGAGLTRMEDSILQGNRLGFRGNEDLGNDLSAFFNLEMGFAGDTGALRQGGLGFGRVSIVGLAHKTYGELSMGRQFDQMNAALIRFSPIVSAGVYSATVGDADRVAGNWLNNMVTYKSPDLGGFKFNAQYSFSEKGTSATNAGNAYSLGTTYSNGNFNAAAAMTEIRGHSITPGSALGVSQFMGTAVSRSTVVTLSNYRTAGVGAGYTLGQVTMSGLLTNTRYTVASGPSRELTSIAIPVVYRPSAQWLFEAGYTQSRFEDSRWHHVSLMADYFLSRRTDVYVSANLEKASGDGTSAVIFTLPTSGSSRQTALRVGIRHRF